MNRKSHLTFLFESQWEQVLLSIPVDIDDPAFVVNWNYHALALFVRAANLPAAPPLPNFITTAPGLMTITSFTTDIMGHLGTHGGGLHGAVIIAPNTLNQYAVIREALARDIEMHPFIQACMALLPPITTLATTYQISDRKAVTTVVPAPRLPPPPPGILAFQ
jgi:hypothetical protein